MILTAFTCPVHGVEGTVPSLPFPAPGPHSHHNLDDYIYVTPPADARGFPANAPAVIRKMPDGWMGFGPCVSGRLRGGHELTGISGFGPGRVTAEDVLPVQQGRSLPCQGFRTA